MRCSHFASVIQFTHSILASRFVRFRRLLAVLLLLVIWTEPQVLAQTGPQPGATDPMGKPSRYYLLRDDELFAPGISPAINEFWDYTYFPDANLKLPSSIVTVGSPSNLDLSYEPQLFAASGRITVPDHDQVIYAHRTSSPGGWFGLFFVDRAPPALSYYLSGLADRSSNGSDFLSIAVGDLDKLADSAGGYHDEVVVAYASSGANNTYQINVTVLDYTEICSGGTSSMQPCGIITAQASQAVDSDDLPDGPDNLLSVAVGDFDGDGKDEIALAYLQNQTTLWVTTFRYTNDGKGDRTLKEIDATSVTQPASAPFTATISIQAGDFNGDGPDEVAVGGAVVIPSPLQLNGFVLIFQSDAHLKLEYVSTTDVFLEPLPPPLTLNPPTQRLQVVTGLFQFDPGAGYDFGRRQFAVAYNDGMGNLVFEAYTVSSDLQTSTPLFTPIVLQNANTAARFSIAAGGYRGVKDSQNPVWGLGFSTTSSNPAIYGVFVGLIDVASGQIVTYISAANQQFYPNLRMPVVAYDYDGDSIYLGAPVHLTVEHVLNTDFVLQEPPKHAYYDNDASSPTYGQIVSVSREDSFNVQLQDSTGTTFSSRSTDTSDFDVGASLSTSASGTFKEGEDVGIEEAEDETTVTVSAEATYDYKAHQESYDSQYASRTVSFTGSTDHDDYLNGRLQLFDIWRYRIYGISSTDSQGNPTNAYYEVVLPGPVLDFAGGGLGFDWYQPVHENGNILSYPARLGSNPDQPFLPDDLGGYTDATGATVAAPMVPASQQAFDGTSGTIGLQYSSTSGSGYISSYSHSLNASIDVQVSNKASASFFGEGGSLSTCVAVGFHDGLSFGHSSTSDQTTNNSTGITLNKPSGDTTQGYNFYPVFYVTQDGTVKAAHAVDVLGNADGQDFWAGVYGAKSDPALNLPSRFNPVYSTETNTLVGWEPNLLSSRKQLRGFFLQKPTVNPVSNDYDSLAYAPVAGDPVRVVARVYNYSTGQSFGQDLLVDFQAIQYDSADDTETPYSNSNPCPNSQPVTNGRCSIGQTTVMSLDALQMTTAAIVWNTAGFGPSTAGGSLQYRIYVVLDPQNAIQEIYDTEDPNQTYRWVDINGQSQNLPVGIDPGQNNEGFGLATIVAANPSPSPADPSPSPAASGCSPGTAADVSLRKGSVAALDVHDGDLHTHLARAALGQPTRLRVTVYSDRSHCEFSHLLVYDGDPRQGGTLIADKVVHSGNPEGTHVWIDWIPRTSGLHGIVARVVQDHDDPIPDNHEDAIIVRVMSPRRGRGADHAGMKNRAPLAPDTDRLE